MSHEGAQDTRNRSLLSVGRGTIKLVYDQFKMQMAQVSLFAGEIRDKVERMQQYGFTSVPLPGAEATVVSISGNRDHTIIIATDDRRYRIKNLKGGEVAIYTDEGDSVILKRNRNMELNTQNLTINASTVVTVNSPNLNVTGNISAGGFIKDLSTGAGVTMQAMRATFNSHTHPENNATNGNTNIPNQQMQ